MNRKLFNIIISLICSVFLVTIISTGIVLYSDYKTGSEAAKNRFEKLFNQTEDAISKTQVPDDTFMKAFTKAVGSTEYYYSLNLKSGNQDIYQYPAVQKKTNKLFTKTWSRRITEGSTLDLNLTALIYALPSSIIYSRLKIAFIIILSVTILSGICLIYLYASSNKKSSEKDEFSFKDDDLDFESESDVDSDSELDFPDFPEEENINDSDTELNEEPQESLASELDIAPVSSEVDSETVSNDINIQNGFTDENDIAQDTEKTDPTIVKVNTDQEEKSNSEDIVSTETTESTSSIQPSDNNNTNTLFGTVTGFCSEKILITRLESELSRASSSELDLSLILIKIPEINFDSKCGIEICNKILNIFHYRDIIFEYKTDGIAVIFNGADIDKAMELSEQMYAELCSILTTAELNIKPYFGIAARSLRFISGERLIIEAEQALLHAGEDPESPIIAFRVNPEKYRKFMAEKTN